MKELLPIGSVVLLQGLNKKIMIVGVLQVKQEANKLYDYLGVPYPEGYIGESKNILFNHDKINDVIFTGYDNPERRGFLEILKLAYDKYSDEFKNE